MNKTQQKHYKKYQTTSRSEEDYDYEPDQFLGYHESQEVISTVTVALDESIKQPKYYRHVLARISNLEEGDNLLFELRTPGGDIQGILSLIHAMQSTDANVHCHIDTDACSAGSLFALSCPSVSVAPWSRMMVHTAVGGSINTVSNGAAYSNFMDTEIRKLMKEAYEGFLTPEELDDVFMGRELWFNAEQIVERLQRKQQFLQENSDDCNGTCEDCNCNSPSKIPNLPKDWDKYD